MKNIKQQPKQFKLKVKKLGSMFEIDGELVGQVFSKN
jgi:hypothetical protein